MPTKRTTAKRPTAATKKSSVTRRKSMQKTSKKHATHRATTLPPKRPIGIGMHLAIAGSAIALMLLIGSREHGTFSTGSGSASDALPTAISFEHTLPLQASMLVAKKGTSGYVSIESSSSEPISLSVPSEWERAEVTGASLGDITSTLPNFGFTRWNLPARAGIKFLVRNVPESVLLESVGTATAAIELSSVDVVSRWHTRRVLLIQGSTHANLWAE